MKSEEFCSNCKHHYTFHLMGKGKCEKLYPPRTVNYIDNGVEDFIIYSDTNHCLCKEFKE